MLRYLATTMDAACTLNNPLIIDPLIAPYEFQTLIDIKEWLILNCSLECPHGFESACTTSQSTPQDT